LKSPTFLTVPGYTGSGPRHWQSIWETQDGAMRRIEQRDWNRPEPDEWSAAIDSAIRAAGSAAVVLVAHSCGSIAVAHWAARSKTPIAGAFLVAPPDDTSANIDDAVRAFGMPALSPLPFASLVVASETDPYCEFSRAAHLASAWGARIVSAGRAGHINTASGHGPWPEGRRLLANFCGSLRS
jgi:uncharacterized protein